jgi:hypothetical protein
MNQIAIFSFISYFFFKLPLRLFYHSHFSYRLGKFISRSSNGSVFVWLFVCLLAIILNAEAFDHPKPIFCEDSKGASDIDANHSSLLGLSSFHNQTTASKQRLGLIVKDRRIEVLPDWNCKPQRVNLVVGEEPYHHKIQFITIFSSDDVSRFQNGSQ